MVLAVERLLEELKARFDVPVFTKVPRYEAPGLFIRVDAGEPRASTVVSEDTLMAVQVYGGDLDETITLIGRLRQYLMDECYRVNPHIVWWREEAGPHEFPDPDTDTHTRYQLTGVLTTTLDLPA
ncbi:hypothetical protein [Corynebacterium tapiri]|uniref:DUF3168 domain-containing protein n=1 Tax=Corynebacterium tapiri TaxID=1448266 RepID=A0A5C4U4Q8_9CORY|nr:hypothetical protein [Corynebacterium tapiri]TNL98775.1 hypothetical protein FHE74_03920 [Corynebacterium tapiri]